MSLAEKEPDVAGGYLTLPRPLCMATCPRRVVEIARRVLAGQGPECQVGEGLQAHCGPTCDLQALQQGKAYARANNVRQGRLGADCFS